MKKIVKSLLAVMTAVCVSASMAGCGGGNSEKDIEARLNKLDKMSEEDAEKQMEKNLGKLDGSSSADTEDGAVAAYLAQKIYMSATGYLTRLAITAEPVPDFNTLKYDLAEEGLLDKNGKYETEINGKKKNIKWSLDDADVYGEVNKYTVIYVTVKYGGESFTYPEVANKMESVDPFENLTVTFSGTSPKSKVEISGGNSLCKYTADKSEGVFNGDTVTVTAEFKSSQSDKILAETEKQYTAEGLSAYAMSIDEIPQDMQEKIRAQAENLITSDVAKSNMKKIEEIGLESYSFECKNMDFIGYYFLCGKEGTDANPYNKLCCAYKMKYEVIAYEYDSSLEGKRRNSDEHTTGEDEFYTLCELNNILLLDDGTCSCDLTSMKITSDTVKLGDRFCNYYGYKLNGFGYSWKGYSDIDSMFNKCVAERTGKYNYETTVK